MILGDPWETVQGITTYNLRTSDTDQADLQLCSPSWSGSYALACLPSAEVTVIAAVPLLKQLCLWVYVVGAWRSPGAEFTGAVSTGNQTLSSGGAVLLTINLFISPLPRNNGFNPVLGGLLSTTVCSRIDRCTALLFWFRRLKLPALPLFLFSPLSPSPLLYFVHRHKVLVCQRSHFMSKTAIPAQISIPSGVIAQSPQIQSEVSSRCLDWRNGGTVNEQCTWG